MVDLSGKIVLVTGAAGAIGSAVVQAIKQASGTAIGRDLPGKPGIDTILDVSLNPTGSAPMPISNRNTAGLTGL